MGGGVKTVSGERLTVNGERIEVRSPFAFRSIIRNIELRSKVLTFGNVQINLTLLVQFALVRHKK